MSSDDKSREARVQARAAWPSRIYRGGQVPADDEDLSASTTAEQRLAMMWELAVTGHLLAGRSLPDYTRETMPTQLFYRGRILRPSR